MKSQPRSLLMQQNIVLWTGHCLVLCGTVLVAASYWALGFYGTFLGMSFGCSFQQCADNYNSFSCFTTRCYASAVLAMALCPSVCLSVTSRSCIKMAKRRITQTTPHDSTGTLVFFCQRSPRNSTGVTPKNGSVHVYYTSAHLNPPTS